MTRSSFVLLLLAVAGCATSGSDGPAPPSQFPTRSKLEQLAAAPPPAKIAADPGLAVDGWQLKGQLPDAIEPMQYSDGSPWQALLAEAAAARPGLVSLPASMHCVAEETGQFFLEKRALPAERLARFIAGRCGAVSAGPRVTYLEGQVPDGTSLERIVEHDRPQIVDDLARVLKSGVLQAGIWIGQRNGRAVVMISVAERRANLDTLALVPAPDGRVVIRGELLESADHVEAVFNRGHFGFGRCSVDATVLLPRFAVTCDVDAADASAWIEVAAFPAGRILGRIVASLVVFPTRAPTSVYHDAGYVTRSVPAGADARDQLLSLLNEVRHGAGLTEVVLAARQSIVAERVAPHYFGALAGAEPELVADEIVLGLRAGWDVEGDVLNGSFTSGAVVATDDLGQLLDAVLERPSGRATLLDHASRFVAFGPLLALEQKVLAMVATSYTLFEGANHAADAQRVLGRLTKARLDQQMSPPPRAPNLQSHADDAAARVQRGELTPKRALERMLQHSAERFAGVGFHGWMFEASSIDDIRFPADLLRAPLGGVAIAVTHYRPKNGPWSRLVIFVLTAAPSSHGLTTVRADRTRS